MQSSKKIKLGQIEESFYIHMNQYVQYVQNPTGWFGRAIGPQNVSWHTSADMHTNSIGTTSNNISAESPSVILPFDCVVEEAFMKIQRTNDNGTRTINLQFHAYDSSSGVAINKQLMLNYSSNANFGVKTLNTDFTIPANTFLKGQQVTTVVNQSTNSTGCAISWEVLIKLKKI